MYARKRHGALLMVATALAATVSAQSPTPVRTEEVRAELVQEHRRVTGSLQAVARTSVASQEPGQVLAVNVDEGMMVQAGDVIAQLDARRLTAQLAEARARVERLRSALVERESELTFATFERRRIATLYDQQAANDRERVAAETGLQAAEARVVAAERAIGEATRQLELLEIRLADTTVRAPFDARVVARQVDAGEWIEPGEPIVTVVSTGAIEARLEVPERFAAVVAREVERIHLELAGLDRTVASSQVRVIPDVNPQARIFSVILTIDDPDAYLAPGMSVAAWIPTSDQAEHLTVPKSALVRADDASYVYRSDPGSAGEPTAVRTPVRVLFDWEDRVVVAAEGLAAGDRVIVEGNERIAPGTRLTLADAR